MFSSVNTNTNTSNRPSSSSQDLWGSNSSVSASQNVSNNSNLTTSNLTTSSNNNNLVTSTTSSIWDQLFTVEDFEQQEKDYTVLNKGILVSESVGFVILLIFFSKKKKFLLSDAVVFLIDCSPRMFVPNEEGMQPFVGAMKCVSAAVSGKVISAPQDDLAVVLYGTGVQKGDFEGIYVVQEFDKPSATLVQTLGELEENYSYGHFEDDHPGEEFPLCDAFWTASSLFGKIKTDSRRVFLFTDEDTPHTDEDNLSRARARLHDYETSRIEVELFAFDRADHEFQLAPFYSMLNVGSEDEEENRLWKAFNKLEDMVEKTKMKVVKKRTLAMLKFSLCDGVEMGVKIYSMIREAENTKFVYMDPQTMFPVKPNTQWVCRDTGMLLRAPQIKKYYPYGDAKVVFESHETKALKNIYPAGIQLLGFKDRSSLKEYHNLTHSTFVFPDDASVKGSMQLFLALLDKCLTLQKIAIVRMTRSGVSYLAAMLPQKEIWVNGLQKEPSGFHLITLPYADDLRNIEVEQDWSKIQPSEDDVLRARQMVQTLEVGYDPQEFENPALQKHYAALQAYALGKQEEVDEVEDHIFPDKDGLEQFGHVIENWKSAVVPSYYVPSTTAKKSGGGTKRTAAAVEYNGDWDELITVDSNARKVTIPQIKTKLRELGLPVSGKKDDLWQRLKEGMNKKNNTGRNVRIKTEEVKKEKEDEDD